MECTAEQCLLDARKLCQVLELLPDGIVVVDAVGSPLFINGPASLLLGLREGGSSFLSRLSQVLRFDPLHLTGPACGETLIDEASHHVCVFPLPEDGQKAGALIVFRDASMLRQAEQIKTDFVSIASHELRNPLTSVKNALDILAALAGKGDMEKQERFLALASRNVDRISALISEYLDIAKIETGKMSFEFQELCLADFIAPVVAEFKERAAQKHIDISCEIEAGLPSVFADPPKLEQIFFNLIGNALKFTGEGGRITVEARKADRPVSGEARLHGVGICVADTGIGIPDDKRKLVFEKFYRVKNSPEIGQEGAGLGLAIVKKLVEAHRGDICAEANEPAGSRFCIFLPAHTGERRDPGFRLLFDREFQRARTSLNPLSLFIIIVEHADMLCEGESPDFVMRKIKTVIEKSLYRRSDVVGRHRTHDLFAVFCEADMAGAASISKRIAAHIVDVLISQYGKAARDVRVRIGFSTYPEDADSQRDLFRRALKTAREDEHGKEENIDC